MPTSWNAIGRGWADLPDTIKNENDLIEFVKTKPEIHCGGSFYDNTIRDKLGKWNAVRIDGFFFYNKLGAVSKLLKRKRELKKLYPEYKETMKGTAGSGNASGYAQYAESVKDSSLLFRQTVLNCLPVG